MVKQSLGVGTGVLKGVTLKDIPGIPGIYKAGSDGRIYSYSEARTNAKKPKPFALADCRNDKYYCITICQGERKGSRSVHELVCLAFHGPKPSPRLCVRHLDGDWSNNKPDNLKWGTYAENEADKRRHGKTAIGAKQGSAKLTEEAVKIIRASIPYGLWDSVNAAKVFGVTPSTINQIARGRNWKHIK
jgi:hypothetical protein